MMIVANESKVDVEAFKKKIKNSQVRRLFIGLTFSFFTIHICMVKLFCLLDKKK